MGEIVGVYATSHSPGITGFPERAAPGPCDRIKAAFKVIHDDLVAQSPDLLILVSVEHFTNFFLNNFPAFGIATAESYLGPATPEMAGFLRIPQSVYAGAPEIAEQIYTYAIQSDFDPALVAGDLLFDENFCVPLSQLDPERRYPVLPIIVNGVNPPCPRLARCFAFGQMLRSAVRDLTGISRVAVIGTGGLSHWVGLPEAGNINEDFDRRFLAGLAAGDVSALTAISDEEIELAGNGAHEVRPWLVAAGAADGAPFDIAAYEPIPEWLTGTAVAKAQFSRMRRG
jgi:hypothetical protein